VAPITSSLKGVLGRLQQKLAGKAETAYTDRDAADVSGEHDAQVFAAGEAHAYGHAADAVRDAQDEADTK
jgi:hypothetical protein